MCSVGLLVYEMKPANANKIGKNQDMFIKFSSLAMIFMGGLYMLMVCKTFNAYHFIRMHLLSS